MDLDKAFDQHRAEALIPVRGIAWRADFATTDPMTGGRLIVPFFFAGFQHDGCKHVLGTPLN